MASARMARAMTSASTNGTLSHCDPCVDQCMNTSLFDFLLKGVLLNTVNLLGLVCNATAIYILSRKQMRSSISCCLIGLAIYDILVLSCSIFIWGIPAVTRYTGHWQDVTDHAIPRATPWLFLLVNIAHTGSTYVTVAVTIERYVAVCHPLRSRIVCTYGRARLYMLAISAFVVLYSVPKFLETEARPLVTRGGTVTSYTTCSTALRRDPVYIKVYIVWMYFLVMYCLPFGTLLVLNALIYRHVRVANMARQLLSHHQRSEISLASLLFAIVLLFLGCNSLAFVINIIELCGGQEVVDEARLTPLTDVSTLLVNISSSTNFFIYCVFGHKFRRLFLRIFCGAARRRIRRWRATIGELTAAEPTAAGEMPLALVPLYAAASATTPLSATNSTTVPPAAESRKRRAEML